MTHSAMFKCIIVIEIEELSNHFFPSYIFKTLTNAMIWNYYHYYKSLSLRNGGIIPLLLLGVSYLFPTVVRHEIDLSLYLVY